MSEDMAFLANTKHWEGYICPSRSLVQWRRRRSKGLSSNEALEEIKVTENRISGFLYYPGDGAHSKVNGVHLRGDFILMHGESEWRELVSLSIVALKKMALRRLIVTDDKLDWLCWKVK